MYFYRWLKNLNFKLISSHLFEIQHFSRNNIQVIWRARYCLFFSSKACIRIRIVPGSGRARQRETCNDPLVLIKTTCNALMYIQLTSPAPTGKNYKEIARGGFLCLRSRVFASKTRAVWHVRIILSHSGTQLRDSDAHWRETRVNIAHLIELNRRRDNNMYAR